MLGTTLASILGSPIFCYYHAVLQVNKSKSFIHQLHGSRQNPIAQQNEHTKDSFFKLFFSRESRWTSAIAYVYQDSFSQERVK